MPKVTTAHKESRRDQILDAALACFVERGFQGTSMADVFEASGLSAGAVYSYFSSKQELATAAAKRAIGAQAGRILDLAAAPSVPAPSEIIRSIAEGFRQLGIPTSILVQLWGEAATDPDFFRIASDAFATFDSGFRAVLARWAMQRRGLPEEEAQAWAAEVIPVMLALGQGYILQSTLMPGFDSERYLAGVERVLG